MLIDTLYLLAGFLLVIKGGDLFVDSSVDIARTLHLPRIVVGGTIVSLATTAPELVVSATASVMGDSGIALGNAVGSAIANIALIIGVMAVMGTIRVHLEDLKKRWIWMFVAAVLAILFSMNLHLGRRLAFVLVLFSLTYLIYDCVNAVKNKRKLAEQADEAEELFGHEKVMLKKEWLIFGLGAILVVVGSRFLVTGGVGIAEKMGIPSVIIGLSVIAFGTSLPELVTAIMSAKKNVPDLAIGNIIGANVLNLSMITGTSGLIHPLTVTAFTRNFSYPALLLFVLGIMVMFWKDGTVRRKEGIILLVGYVLYIVGLFVLPGIFSH